MAGSSRSHTRLRRTPAGETLLDRRPDRGKRWTRPHVFDPDARDRGIADILRRLDRRGTVDRILNRATPDGGSTDSLRELVTVHVERVLDSLPAPLRPTTPPPPCPVPPPDLPVRTFLVDDVAHVFAASPGTRLADAAPCLGCGAEAVSLGRCNRCQPDDPPLRDGRERSPWVLRLLSACNAAEVVTLAREPVR